MRRRVLASKGNSPKTGHLGNFVPGALSGAIGALRTIIVVYQVCRSWIITGGWIWTKIADKVSCGLHSVRLVRLDRLGYLSLG